MPGTVDDFIQRFSGSKTMDDQQASHYVDRFVSSDPQDQEYDQRELASGASEYLGKLPDNEFQQAAQGAYANASPTQQQGLMGSLMNALQGRGANLGGLAGLAGLLGKGRSNTTHVDPSQYAQLANLARQQHPEAMQEVVRENPWFIKAMGNPVVMGALGMVASRMIKKRTQQTPRSSSSSNREEGLLGKLF